METFFAIIGALASAVTVITGIALLAKWVFLRLTTVSPQEKLKHRVQLRDGFLKNIREKDQYGTHGDAIIRNINKIDSYPQIDEKRKGISPWFKVEIKGLYHRGIEAFIHPPLDIVIDRKTGKYRFPKSKDERGELIAYAVGRIPFDCIEKIDWEGDEYYNSPHIYCRFNQSNGQPYETIVFYGKTKGSEFLYELKDFRPWDKHANPVQSFFQRIVK